MARVNRFTNPSFETNVTGLSFGSQVSSVSTTTFAPAVLVGTTACAWTAGAAPTATTVYLGQSIAGAVAPGEWVAARIPVRRSGSTSYLRARVAFYNSGALVSNAAYGDMVSTSSVYAYAICSAVAPAGVNEARVFVYSYSSAAGAAEVAGASLHTDAWMGVVAATEVQALADLLPYFDGSFPVNPDWTYSWSGTAHASTSLETATPGLYVVPVLGAPCPRVEITVTGLDPVGPSRVTVWRSTVGGKRRAVRGWKNRLVFGSDIEIDYEAPLGREIRYDLQVISGAVTPLRVTATCTLAATEGLIQDPLVPSSNVPLVDFSGSGIPTPTLAPSAFRKLTYDMGSSQERVLGSDTPVGFAGQRMVAAGVDFSTLTDSAEQGTALRNLLMTAYPILVRPLPEWGDLPDLLYLDVPQPTEEPLNAHTGGTLTRWTLAGDQVTPPSLSVVVPLWTYDQVQDLFAAYTYAYRESLAVGINATYMDDQRDPTLGG